VEIRTEEEAIELAKNYALHKLILKWLKTKERKTIEEIKRILK